MLSSPVSSKALTRMVKLSDSAKSTRFLASKAATFPWWLFSIDSKFKGDWAASLGDNKTWGFSAANLPWILSTSSVGSLIRKMASIEFKIQIPKNNLINMSFHCRFLWPCFLAETSLSEKIWLFPLFSTIPLRCFATITKAAMLPALMGFSFSGNNRADLVLLTAVIKASHETHQVESVSKAKIVMIGFVR